jgi:oligopeptide/dipeptide ABC transporter ATP-binding protein
MPDRIPPILVVDGLRKQFQRAGGRFLRAARPADTTRPALVEVGFDLQAGEILGVVGESGSGKSTLARCITLLERPDAGHVFFEGHDLTTLRGTELRRARRRLQIVFQDPYSSLDPTQSAGDAIGEVLAVHHLADSRGREARIGELLASVGLPPEAAGRYPSDFSGGQRQRICIARSLAAEPEVLIADEAVSSLDVSIQAQILNLLLDLRDRLGLAVLFISHNLHVVRRIAPRVAVMFGGRIVELLPPDVPLEAARHPYTRALVAAIRTLAPLPDWAELDASADIARRLPVVGCPYRDRCPLAMKRCTTIDPELLAVGPGHLVACHAVATQDGMLP